MPNLTQTFSIFNKLMSLNEYRNEHYFKLNKVKCQWSEMVKLAIMFNDIKPVRAAEIRFMFHFPDKRRRDLDNYAATIKMIMDGLVTHGILEDDSYTYVRKLEITGQSTKDKSEGVTVEIEEVT